MVGAYILPTNLTAITWLFHVLSLAKMSHFKEEKEIKDFQAFLFDLYSYSA